MDEFLLNPNVAYLALVLSTWLAMMAILTPGTGFIEVTAVFALLMAGWGIYNLPVNLWAVALLGLGIIPLVYAMRGRGDFRLLGISIIAIMAGSAFFFRGNAWWQPAVDPLLVAIVSILSGVFFWFGGHKVLQASLERPRHDLQSLVGETGEAKTDILEEGSVQVAGELWSARSQEAIQAGSQVRVINREGFTVTVEAVKKQSTP